MRTWLGVAALVGCLTGCGQPGTPPADEATGRARLAMTGTGSDGVVYRIVGWTLRFEGPQALVVPETEADPSAGWVSVPLKVGAYTVALEGAWRVERADAPGVPVEVTLVSPNPLGLVVRVDQETPARFVFKLPAEGLATVTMGVEAGGWISGSLDLQSWLDPRETHVFDDLIDRPLEFTISYETSRVTRAAWRTTLETGAATVQFGGASALLAGELGPALSGRPLRIQLDAVEGDVLVGLDPLMNVAGPVACQLQLAFFPSPGAFDEDGSPRLGGYVVPAELTLTRGEAVLTATGLVTVEAR